MRSEIGKKSLLIYIAAAFIECILFYSVMWAGFEGYSGVSMEYTAMGERCTLILLCLPPILTVCIFFITLAGFYKKKKSVRFYFMEIAVCILGISAGITAYMIAVYFELPLLEVIHIGVARGIKAAGWLRYPIP